MFPTTWVRDRVWFAVLVGVFHGKGFVVVAQKVTLVRAEGSRISQHHVVEILLIKAAVIYVKSI
jgi:hypothetical protein